MDACDISHRLRDLGDFPPAPRDIPDRGAPQAVTLGGGCFWCVEAVFKELDGVLDVTSGYAGDSAETAHYQAVCSGSTNHAEVVKVTFDPARIQFGEILKVFFSVAHDPTQVDRQGNDRGRQYRSAIFYADEEQRAVAAEYIQLLDDRQTFGRPVATTLEPLEAFYEAESYHQDYAAKNPEQAYVAFMAMPKVEKLQGMYPEALKRG